VAVDWIEGDAEDLPFEDETFDCVLSAFGIQFAPRHEIVAQELARVCRPGGRIGLLNWTPEGHIGDLFKILGRYLPTPPDYASPPPLWGNEEHVRALFEDSSVELEFARGHNPFRFDSPEHFMVFFETHYGPTLKARERLTAEGRWEDCRSEIVEMAGRRNEATDGSLLMNWEGIDMKRFIRFDRLLLAGIVTALAALPLAPAAQAGPPAPDVPGKIQVPDGNKVFLVGHAIGVQIYSCNATSSGFAWGFVAPRADLYGDNGKLIITHFAGPTWQAKDGGKVVGRRVDGVRVDATAIDWLLLSAASTAAGPDGDRLVKTTFIQRINTTGGLAPAAADCNATTAGTVVEVPYTADYYFWKRRG